MASPPGTGDEPPRGGGEPLRALREQVARLAAAARNKDHFLAMLGHELRNLLAPVQNAVEILEQHTGEGVAVQGATGVITRQVSHMVRIIDDLLDLGRVSAGKLTLEREPLAVSVLISRAIEISGSELAARQHRLELRLPEIPVQVQGDLTRLVQVLVNLLNNAARYTDPGGQIALEVRAAAGEVELRVRDSGAGIPAAKLDQIFELFAQPRQQTADGSRSGGLGLGLPLARRIVELHGGDVTAHSDGPGSGSLFVVRLPRSYAAAPTPAAEAAVQEPAAAAQAPLRVMIVDDNVDSAETVALLLAMAGHETRTAVDGATALALAEAFQPHVAVLDIGMPRMNGFELARALRGRQGTAGPPLVLAMSGHGQPEDRAAATAAGFDDYLLKPIDTNHLRSLLAALQERMVRE